MEQILIIAPNALSDFVLAVGSMQTVAARHRDARIEILCAPPLRPLAEQLPGISGLIEDTGKPSAAAALIHRLAAGGYTRIYDLQGGPQTRQYLRLMRWILPPGTLMWYRLRGAVGEAPRLLHLQKLRRFGCGSISVSPVNFIPMPADLSFLQGELDAELALPERSVLLIPGGGTGSGARWPVEHYAAIARRLAERGISSLIIGTKAERESSAAICNAAPGLSLDLSAGVPLTAIPSLARQSLCSLGHPSGLASLVALSGAPCLWLTSAIGAAPPGGARTEILRADATLDTLSVDAVWRALEPHLA